MQQLELMPTSVITPHLINQGKLQRWKRQRPLNKPNSSLGWHTCRAQRNSWDLQTAVCEQGRSWILFCKQWARGEFRYKSEAVSMCRGWPCEMTWPPQLSLQPSRLHWLIKATRQSALTNQRPVNESQSVSSIYLSARWVWLQGPQSGLSI